MPNRRCAHVGCPRLSERALCPEHRTRAEDPRDEGVKKRVDPVIEDVMEHDWAAYGFRGGKATAERMTSDERVARAKKAALARWGM